VGLTVKCAFISTNKVLENLMKEMTFINMSKKVSQGIMSSSNQVLEKREGFGEKD